MAYLIRYHNSSRSNRYLTDDDVLDKRSCGNLQYFSTPHQAQDHVLVYMTAITKQELLLNRDKENFDIVDTQNNVIGNLFDTNIEDKIMTKEDTAISGSNLDETFDELRHHLGHALILDLEFYKDKLDKQAQPRMAQIASTILGGSSKRNAFNGFVFDPAHMDSEQQLQFLKEHNVTYKQALCSTSDAIMAQVGDFIKEHDIDTIISWGHSLDFSVLSKEGYSDIIPGKMHTLDLEIILSQVNKKQDVSLNLGNYCRLLNLKNDGEWHNALDDAKMIKKVCTLYLNVLTQPLEDQEAENINTSLISTSTDDDNEVETENKLLRLG